MHGKKKQNMTVGFGRIPYLGGARVPVVGLRTVTDPSTSGVPLVNQSLDGVQTLDAH